MSLLRCNIGKWIDKDSSHVYLKVQVVSSRISSTAHIANNLTGSNN